MLSCFIFNSLFLHISKIAKEHIRRVDDYIQIGEKVTVKVTEIDNQGRINLAMNELREKRVDLNEENVEVEQNIEKSSEENVED